MEHIFLAKLTLLVIITSQLNGRIADKTKPIIERVEKPESITSLPVKNSNHTPTPTFYYDPTKIPTHTSTPTPTPGVTLVPPTETPHPLPTRCDLLCPMIACLDQPNSRSIDSCHCPCVPPPIY